MVVPTTKSAVTRAGTATATATGAATGTATSTATGTTIDTAIGTPKRKPGRPPSDDARHAVLQAAYRVLINEGLGRLTIERVAGETGVGKPTIYRSWTSAQDLAMAALMAQPLADATPTRSRSARGALRAHLQRVIETFATPRGRQITLTMASADPESELAKVFRNQVILRSREAGRLLLQQAARNEQVRNNIDIEVVLDMLYGPLFFRLLTGHLPLSAQLADHLVDSIFDGIAKV